jgi:hypothetical protein
MTRRQMEETCECNMVEPEICNCDLDLCERCRERARKGYEQAIQNATFNVIFPGAGDWENGGHD